MKDKVVEFVIHYGLDIIFSIFLIICSTIINGIPPYRRFFVERDASLSYPLDREEVTVYSLAFLSIAIPFGIMTFMQFSIFLRKKHIGEDKFNKVFRSPFVHYTFLPYLLWLQSIAIALFITTIFKEFNGRLRPNFFCYVRLQRI